MLRLFRQHTIRKTQELSSCLWDFCTISEKGRGKVRKVPVPGCWETYPETETYRGKASYKRTFEASGNIRLVFKGVSHSAVVLVDGKKIGRHYNAYTPFELEVGSLELGCHELEVLVDNSYGADSSLHIPNDYQSYGGISRGVMLEFVEDVYIAWIHFTPIRKGDGWYGRTEICLRNLSKEHFSGSLQIEMDVQRNLIPFEAAADSEIIVRSEWIRYPYVENWTPETPHLYLLTANVMDSRGKNIDDLTERIGFREIAVKGKEILLNGQRMRIKGLCRHEDHPQFGCALPVAAMFQDLALIKDMGGNSVRTVHYPNDELFLDLCDELGILVWEESHARGLSEDNMRHPLFQEQSDACIREMITAHYNHPSVYVWGILNECASDTWYGRSCYEHQYKMVRSLDQSRPCSSASCKIRTDICLDLPDFAAFNIYPEWYEDERPEDYLRKLYNWIQSDTEGADKPFLITETGAGAIYGYRTPGHVKWSEEYQAEVIRDQLQAILNQEGCSGVYIWQFCDVRVSDEWFFARPRTMNNKGIVDEYRRPKLAYNTVKEIFSNMR